MSCCTTTGLIDSAAGQVIVKSVVATSAEVQSVIVNTSTEQIRATFAVTADDFGGINSQHFDDEFDLSSVLAAGDRLEVGCNLEEVKRTGCLVFILLLLDGFLSEQSEKTKLTSVL